MKLCCSTISLTRNGRTIDYEVNYVTSLDRCDAIILIQNIIDGYYPFHSFDELEILALRKLEDINKY